jgi:hypothetical protein
MAANKQFPFIGTDQSPFAVEMNKRSFSVMQRGSFSPPNVSAITADQYGYVTLTFGSFRSFHATFIVCDPDGNIAGDGGGSPFTLNSVQALQTSALP